MMNLSECIILLQCSSNSCIIAPYCFIPTQVAKKYDEVEELHTKLVAKFPSVNFPSLPKLSLIVTEKTLNERKRFLEDLLSLIARTPKLCSSSPLLTFLEVSKISIKQNELKKPEPEKPEPEKPKVCKDCLIWIAFQYGQLFLIETPLSNAHTSL